MPSAYITFWERIQIESEAFRSVIHNRQQGAQAPDKDQKMKSNHEMSFLLRCSLLVTLDIAIPGLPSDSQQQTPLCQFPNNN